VVFHDHEARVGKQGLHARPVNKALVLFAGRGAENADTRAKRVHPPEPRMGSGQRDAPIRSQKVLEARQQCHRIGYVFNDRESRNRIEALVNGLFRHEMKLGIALPGQGERDVIHIHSQVIVRPAKTCQYANAAAKIEHAASEMRAYRPQAPAAQPRRQQSQGLVSHFCSFPAALR